MEEQLTHVESTYERLESEVETERESAFEKDLTDLINRYSLENGSNTPDGILARYLIGCLKVYDEAVRDRDYWFGICPVPGDPHRNHDGPCGHDVHPQFNGQYPRRVEEEAENKIFLDEWIALTVEMQKRGWRSFDIVHHFGEMTAVTDPALRLARLRDLRAKVVG